MTLNKVWLQDDPNLPAVPPVVDVESSDDDLRARGNDISH